MTGDFTKITSKNTSILAKKTLHISKITQATLDAFMEHAAKRMHAAHNASDHNLVNNAVKLMTNMVAIDSHIGLTPKQPNI